MYEESGKPGCLRRMFMLGPKATTSNLDNFVALIYGGTTSRFKQHQKVQKQLDNLEKLHRSLSKQDTIGFGHFIKPRTASMSKREKKLSAMRRMQVYPWECLSLVSQNLTTLDLIIREATPLLALIHVAYAHLHSEVNTEHNIRLDGTDFMPIF